MSFRYFAATIGTLLVSSLSTSANAQSVSTTGEWERPYGVAFGQENRPYSGVTTSASAASRNAAGNRVIINGLIQTGVGVSARMNSGVGSNSTAIGNQLNVNVQGRWNTVIINSTQTNNGDINANAQSTGSVSDPDE